MIKKQKFVFIDIEAGRHLRANFEWDKFEGKLSSQRAEGDASGQAHSGAPIFREERRKKIYGRRGEHKEQD